MYVITQNEIINPVSHFCIECYNQFESRAQEKTYITCKQQYKMKSNGEQDFRTILSWTLPRVYMSFLLAPPFKPFTALGTYKALNV